MNRREFTLDVSHLPSYAFGHRSLMWWGTLGMIVIEGFMFALLIATYFYLRGRVPTWPPNASPPSLFYGSINTVVLVLSVIPNAWYKRAAERLDIGIVQRGLIVTIAFAVVSIVIRFFEFHTLNIHWTNNAYGSIVWTLLGLHTTHLLTDVVDSLVLAVLMFGSRIEGKSFVDVSENAFYWYFVIIAWIPIYAVIYLAPRFI